ncbi:hypothetical protein [Clostridium tertium]|uniref:hypothetical protein n=1 Tax=Clostridium tertium TaxID=1559 RepID=UPI002A83C49A|nr:hypothetical protein [Clostridium tertium]MDY4607023.1 hypothetical protein [Clostridium tertium]
MNKEIKKYLRIETGNFYLLTEGMQKIFDSDILITNEDYDLFFDLQSQGRQFRLKDIPTGTELFDYVEEFKAEVTPVDPVPSETEILKEKVNVLEKENADLLLDSALKDSKIETLQSDIADIMKEMAKGGQI